jgi:hypothetical protein
MATWRGKQRVLTILRRLPPALKAAAEGALDEFTEGELVPALQRACPVGDDLEDTPGQLRDSVHAYAGHRALRSGGVRAEGLKTVVADAKDKKGDFIGPHVEHGHLAKDGGRVPPHPWFFPTWRVHKPSLRRKMAAAGRAAARRIAGDIARG